MSLPVHRIESPQDGALEVRFALVSLPDLSACGRPLEHPLSTLYKHVSHCYDFLRRHAFGWKLHQVYPCRVTDSNNPYCF